MVTVLLIRNIDTANRIAMIPIVTYPTMELIPVKACAVTADLLTLRIPCMDSR